MAAVARAGRAVRRAAPTKSPAKKAAPAKKTVAPAAKRSPAKATKAAPARKAPAKKSAPAPKAPVKKSAPAKVAAKPAPVKAVPAKAVPAKAVPAKAVPVKAVPAKAAPAPAPVAKATPVVPTKAPAVEKPAAPPPPPKSDWTKAELAEIRKELITELTEMAAAYERSMRDLTDLQQAGTDGAGDDQADAGSKTFEREQEQSIAANRRDLLTQLERAVERIDAGTYGFCESCGKPIPKARLRAFPGATLDVACKQREERR